MEGELGPMCPECLIANAVQPSAGDGLEGVAEFLGLEKKKPRRRRQLKKKGS